MNITKLNKRRITTNVVVFNIVLFILFIAVSYFVYQYNFNKTVKAAEHRLKREALSAQKIVKRYYNSQKLLNSKMLSIEKKTLLSVYVYCDKIDLMYPKGTDSSLLKVMLDKDGYFYHNGSLFFSHSIKIKDKNSLKIIDLTVEYPVAALNKAKKVYLKNVFYKGLALYVVFAYILSMLILIVSRLNYDKFQTRIFGDLIKQTNDGFIITDDKGSIIFANDSFLRIFKVKLKQVRGENINKFNSYTHDKEFFKSMWGQLNREGSWEGEIINALNDGTKIFTKLKVTTIINKKSRIKYYIGVYEDKTDIRMQKIDILKLQLYDSFTCLPNRTYAKKYLKKLISSKAEFAYLNICIDNFKELNEVYGVEIANKVFLQYIEKIKEIFSPGTFIARIDGKKICVILDVFNMAELENELQKISDISNRPFKLFSESILVATNAGFLFYPEESIKSENILETECRRIEILLKSDSVKKINSILKEKETKKNKMIALMKKAIKCNEFALFYQSRIDANDDSLIGAEALIRWNNKELGNISPMYFIPLAEKCGYIDMITDWTIKQLCSQIEAWKNDFKKIVPISINISPLILSKGITEQFAVAFKKCKLSCNDIQIEITERAINNSCTEIREQINKLSSEGFKILVDNFGTGNSKLNYLKKLNINCLKIDKEFIKNYPEKDDGSVAKIIINMAESLQMEVIGEGAENLEQVNFLRANGCHIIQGYHFSKPVQPEEFAKKYLAER